MACLGRLSNQRGEIYSLRSHQFENVCDVETDKATAEIPSTHDGIIKKLYFKVDEVCLVGHALADIEVDDGASVIGDPNQKFFETPHSDHVSHSYKTDPAKKQVDKESTAPPGNSQALATPAVRHLVKTHGLKIEDIPGTGKDGRVTKEDVLKFVESKAGGAKTEESKGQSTGSSTHGFPKLPPLTGVTAEDK